MDDKKVQRELKDAATSLRDAGDALRGGKRKRKRGRIGKLLLVALVGGAIAMVASEGMRKKVLDALFGAEEEFEYTSTTTPETTSAPQSSPSAAGGSG